MNLSQKAAVKPNILLFLCCIIFIVGLIVKPVQGTQNTIQVPGDYPSIQAAVDAAVDGDIVLVSPGIYFESVNISGKTITLASLFYTSHDPQYITDTIIDANSSWGVYIGSNVGAETTVTGFTIRNGSDGVRAQSKLNILNNRIVSNADGIDFESGSGGLVQNNLFENNSDDGIDFDGSTEAVVENNIIRNNGEDGIEIRLHTYSGPMLAIIIRDNQIYGNRQDGIQLIDYPDISNRIFTIEGNLIQENGRSGLGLMDNEVSIEDYRAASIPERIQLFNNTFDQNNYAVTGGDNLIAVNNIFLNSVTQGIKNVDGSSVVTYSIFWNNNTDETGSNVELDTTLFANPILDANNVPMYGSPVIDAGTASFEWGGETVLDISPESYYGEAPDMGCIETNYTGSPPSPTSSPYDYLTFLPVEDATIRAAYPDNNFGSASSLEVDNSPMQHFLIKFDITGIQGRTVNNATLRLYTVNGSTMGGNFYLVEDDTWQEETITWNNASLPGTTPIDSLGSVSPGAWVEIDLTTIIVEDGILSLRVQSTVGDGADYSSKEGSNPPELLITVENVLSPTSTPTVTPTATHTVIPPTYTFTPTSTDTVAPPTPTFTLSPTDTAVPSTPTFTPSPTDTALPSTPTFTPSPTDTALPSTPTFTPSPTDTALPPTSTFTPSPTGTAVPPTSTFTPSPTGTAVPPTPTFTPLPTDTTVPPPTPTFTVIPATVTPAVQDLIFADDFETGDLSTWTSVRALKNDLGISSSAALVGNFGLQVVINDKHSLYLTDDTPNQETRYRMRFYFDPNSIEMSNGDNHAIFYGYARNTVILQIQFQFLSGIYQLSTLGLDDNGTWHSTPWVTITDNPHPIEVDWRAATGPGENDGHLLFWIDDMLQDQLSTLDNDTQYIDRVHLGVVYGLSRNTYGTYYFDEFVSRRLTYIGP